MHTKGICEQASTYPCTSLSLCLSLFSLCESVRISCIFSISRQFFSHNKSLNSTFSYDFLNKRTSSLFSLSDFLSKIHLCCLSSNDTRTKSELTYQRNEQASTMHHSLFYFSLQNTYIHYRSSNRTRTESELTCQRNHLNLCMEGVSEATLACI